MAARYRSHAAIQHASALVRWLQLWGFGQHVSICIYKLVMGNSTATASTGKKMQPVIQQGYCSKLQLSFWLQSLK